MQHNVIGHNIKTTMKSLENRHLSLYINIFPFKTGSLSDSLFNC